MKVGDSVVYKGPGRLRAGRGSYREAFDEWKGTVQGIEGSVALLELDHPIEFLNVPDAIAIDAIDERMYLPETKVLGYGFAAVLEDLGELPGGHWDHNKTFYILDQAMDVKDTKKICQKNHPGEKRCWLHSVMMTAVPIDKKSKFFGKFEPV